MIQYAIECTNLEKHAGTPLITCKLAHKKRKHRDALICSPAQEAVCLLCKPLHDLVWSSSHGLMRPDSVRQGSDVYLFVVQAAVCKVAL